MSLNVLNLSGEEGGYKRVSGQLRNILRKPCNINEEKRERENIPVYVIVYRRHCPFIPLPFFFLPPGLLSFSTKDSDLPLGAQLPGQRAAGAGGVL